MVGRLDLLGEAAREVIVVRHVLNEVSWPDDRIITFVPRTYADGRSGV